MTCKLTQDGNSLNSSLTDDMDYLGKLIEDCRKLDDKTTPLKEVDMSHLNKAPAYELLTEFDVNIQAGEFICFQTTIQIRDYGGDIAFYLGNTDISNEVPYDRIEVMIGENQ